MRTLLPRRPTSWQGREVRSIGRLTCLRASTLTVRLTPREAQAVRSRPSRLPWRTGLGASCALVLAACAPQHPRPSVPPPGVALGEDLGQHTVSLGAVELDSSVNETWQLRAPPVASLDLELELQARNGLAGFERGGHPQVLRSLGGTRIAARLSRTGGDVVAAASGALGTDWQHSLQGVPNSSRSRLLLWSENTTGLALEPGEYYTLELELSGPGAAAPELDLLVRLVSSPPL